MHHPVKMFEAMMCEKPIITIKRTRMQIDRRNCGLVIDSKNVDDLRLAISR
jgi:hypothetical protein